LFRKPMLDSIEGALGKSGRVRYTCMSASENFVSFGCNTGGVYLFTREKSRFLEVLPSKDGEITALAFGLDEQLLAAGTSNGSIGIWKGPWGSSVTTATLLKVVVEHSESIITSIAWSYDSKRMYSGDQRGLVLATSVTKKPIVPSTTRILPNYKFIHKAVSMALPDSDVVYRCQSPIVQLDVSIAGAVVISSQQQTIIADPHMRQVWIVGAKKPRQGSFGACFGQGSKFPAVYCARPSSRIWIAKSRTGTVSATYNLKDQFTREASPILSSVGQGCSSDAAPVNAKSFAFSKIVIVRENYLLAWTTNTIMIVDSAKARLLGWYSDFKGIIDVSVVGDEIYVLYTGGNENVDNGTAATNFYCDNLALMSPGECATAMATAGNVVDAIEMVLEYFDNATQEKFLENVQQSDLTVLRHLIAGRSESVDVSASPRRKQEEAHEEVLEKKLTEMALTSAQIRMEKENETVQSAESAFMNRIQSTGQELVLDVASDETSDSDASNADIPPPAPPRSVTLQSLKLEGPKFLKKMFAR